MHWIQAIKQENEELKKQLKALEDKVVHTQTPSTIPVRELPDSTMGQLLEQAVTQSAAPVALVPEAPIPLDYRQLVDNVLNKSFDVKIFPRSDVPVFEFVIYVPKRYSNAPQSHWDMYKEDRRLKVLDYAKGANGVREFCELVFNNFNQEQKTMIVTDRINAQ